jgi:hypothetical protein
MHPQFRRIYLAPDDHTDYMWSGWSLRAPAKIVGFRWLFLGIVYYAWRTNSSGQNWSWYPRNNPPK